MLAVNGRNGIAPVALTRDEPVAQAILHGALTGAGSLEVGDDSRFALRVLAAYHAGVLTRLDKHAFAGKGLIPVNRGDNR